MSIEESLGKLRELLKKGPYLSIGTGSVDVTAKKRKCVESFNKLKESCKSRKDEKVIKDRIEELKSSMKEITKKDPCSQKTFREAFEDILEMATLNNKSNAINQQSPSQKQDPKPPRVKTGSGKIEQKNNKSNAISPGSPAQIPKQPTMTSGKKGSKQQISTEVLEEVLRSMKWTAEMDLTKPNSGISQNYRIGDKTNKKDLNAEEKNFLEIFAHYMVIIVSKIDHLNKEMCGLQKQLMKRTDVHERQATVTGRPQTSRVEKDERVQQMKKLLEKITQENHTLKTRLSKMAGVQLTHKNAAIADLSDPNRPTKLAEKYGELYDNSWTDAMEKLQKDCKTENEIEQSEQRFITLLRDDLQKCYNFCIEISEKQLDDIKSVLFLSHGNEASNRSDSLSKEFQKEINETRKCTASTVVEEIQKDFMEKYSNNESSPWEYLKDCLELCWYMVVQDPPVCLYFGDQERGSMIDTERFDFYTRSGKKLDFLVWPALRLEAEGALLRRGVAQPLP